MIRLSKLTDYAIVVMSEMARQMGTVHTVSHLADRTGVPAPTVAKLMKALAQAGLMTSHRGAAGGYALARPSGAISIADIVTALDGPIALTACVEGADDQCGVESLCPMRGNWEKINTAICAALEQVTLADMMVPVWTPPAGEAPPRRRAAAPRHTG
ncbi:SUF system Fe-S cluster assembly regulator [Azospirillum sp. ST 5-10]|uniref:SUF system Fe-S cluster assembly regulator n=1 Tax=unclassified Azospirillum TaxID=2630922 RepID=UPI003F4A2E0F